MSKKSRRERKTAVSRKKKQRNIMIGVGVLGVLLVITAVFLTNTPSTIETIAIDPHNAGLVAMGETVYAAQCAACHGENLEGEVDWQQSGEVLKAPPHDATGHTWHHNDAYLIESVKAGGARLAGQNVGVSSMPAYGDILSDEEITAVLSYIKSKWPSDILIAQSQR